MVRRWVWGEIGIIVRRWVSGEVGIGGDRYHST